MIEIEGPGGETSYRIQVYRKVPVRVGPLIRNRLVPLNESIGAAMPKQEAEKVLAELKPREGQVLKIIPDVVDIS
jgi:hypothetical protein